MHKRIILFLSALCLLIGCQQKDARAKKDYAEPVGLIDETGYERGIAGEFEARAPDKTTFEEKIIKTAYTSIKAPDVSEAYEKAINLAKKYDALILNSTVNSYSDMDEAQLLIKIQPRDFMSLLDELSTIGKIESKSITEEDVTEEYYDIKARLANARKVQERFYGILNKSNKVEDILKVEHEIERVGEKIEVLEGKLNYYDSKVDYSRINISIYCRKTQLIGLNSIGQGFKTALQFAVYFFFFIIWAIIVIIPLVIVILVLRPVISFSLNKLRRKKDHVTK